MKTLKNTLIMAIAICAFACGKKETPAPQNSENNNPTPVIDNCGTDNPVEKLSWIGDLRLKSYPQPRMYAYIHENKMIFAFSECADCHDDKMKIFNCKGETLAEGKAKCDEILQKANSQKLLFDGNLPLCGTDNPVEKLAWIADLRSKTYPQPRMYSYVYDKQIIFAFSETGTFSDEKMKIFNCSGETLAEGKAKCDEMLQKANNQKLLFDGNLTDCDRVKNPATDIAWIAEEIKDAEEYKKQHGKPAEVEIHSYLYRGKRIYKIHFYSGFYAFYDCSHNYLASTESVHYDGIYESYMNESSHFVLIYKP